MLCLASFSTSLWVDRESVDFIPGPNISLGMPCRRFLSFMPRECNVSKPAVKRGMAVVAGWVVPPPLLPTWFVVFVLLLGCS